MAQHPRDYWQGIYQTKSPADVSWYQHRPDRSLQFIHATGIPLDAPIIDVGGGASTLVDHLLLAGFSDLTVLDIAPAGLAAAQARLGAAAGRVQWLAADVTRFQPERRYQLWHDRAVFHFLVAAEARAGYLTSLRLGLAPGGHLVLATFGPEGPTRCSGLPVQRYSLEQLNHLLGPTFHPIESTVEEHRTPGGSRQQFFYGRWRADA